MTEFKANKESMTHINFWKDLAVLFLKNIRKSSFTKKRKHLKNNVCMND